MWKQFNASAVELIVPVRQQAGSRVAAELHLLRSDSGRTRDTKLSAAQYWNDNNMCMGFAPDKQQQFSDGIRTVYAYPDNASVVTKNLKYLVDFALVLCVRQKVNLKSMVSMRSATKT